MNPAVIMTDPAYFQVKAGANPHTREKDGVTLKSVDGVAARRQWERYADILRDHGLEVYVAHANQDLTGMVFAANAGVILSDNAFAASRFTPHHRRGETRLFEDFMRGLGYTVEAVPDGLRFEGQADAFSAAGRQIFTWGFRSDEAAGTWWAERCGHRPVTMKLRDPKFYHGDCTICNLGTAALYYPRGIEPGDLAAFENELMDRAIAVSEDDAARFACNSFYTVVGSTRLLFMMKGVSERLQGQIRELGIEVILVDVSEFFGKGGGGPKCLIFDAGSLPKTSDEAVLQFRSRRLRS